MDPVQAMRSRVRLHQDHVSNVTTPLTQTASTDFPHVYPGIDGSWSLNAFKKNFKVVIGSVEQLEIEFDLIGVDAAIANAFRRIMLSEVPTMAIEQVFFYDNNSIVADEIFAQRVGLVPIKADPRMFEYLTSDPTDINTIVFKLDVACTANPDALPNEIEPAKKYLNSNGILNNNTVLAKDLIWQPAGEQATTFAENPIKPCYEDIVLAKLRPGQAISCELHCQKGIGKEHAKWSPVDIQITSPITGSDAHKFAACFPKGTIEVVTKNGIETAVVANPRKDTASRECLRHDEFKDKVRLTRVRDHFIFSIESVGQYNASEVFESAVDVLSDKCRALKAALNEMGKGDSTDMQE